MLDRGATPLQDGFGALPGIATSAAAPTLPAFTSSFGPPPAGLASSIAWIVRTPAPDLSRTSFETCLPPATGASWRSTGLPSTSGREGAGLSQKRASPGGVDVRGE